MREHQIRIHPVSKSPRTLTQIARNPDHTTNFRSLYASNIYDLPGRFGVEMLYIHESESFIRFRETAGVGKGEAKLVYHDNIGMRDGQQLELFYCGNT